jgi:hypothetical protein
MITWINNSAGISKNWTKIGGMAMVGKWEEGRWMFGC